MLKTHKFARKPFYVDAVRVSEANIEEVAKWCEGSIETNSEGRFISVQVHRPMNERQTQAFVGDWVLYAGTGFKVYTPKAFDKSFEKVKTLTKEQADAAGIKVPHEKSRRPKPPVPTEPKRSIQTMQQESGEVAHTNPVLSKEIAGKIEAEAGRTETETPKTSEEKNDADKLIEEVLRENR